MDHHTMAVNQFKQVIGKDVIDYSCKIKCLLLTINKTRTKTRLIFKKIHIKYEKKDDSLGETIRCILHLAGSIKSQFHLPKEFNCGENDFVDDRGNVLPKIKEKFFTNFITKR